MKRSLFTVLATVFVLPTFAQQTKLWGEADRKYLIDNLSRTRDSIVKETRNLSKAQWNFRESPDRWSINQIVEHLAIWELLLEREVTQALLAGPRPELNKDAKTDSAVIAFLMEEKPHITTEYTKPFTYTVPLGLNDVENNLTWFLKMRNEGVGYVDSTTADLRAYFLRPGRGNVHQVFMTIFAHTDRHLRQINRVKADPKYPNK